MADAAGAGDGGASAAPDGAAARGRCAVVTTATVVPVSGAGEGLGRTIKPWRLVTQGVHVCAPPHRPGTSHRLSRGTKGRRHCAQLLVHAATGKPLSAEAAALPPQYVCVTRVFVPPRSTHQQPPAATTTNSSDTSSVVFLTPPARYRYRDAVRAFYACVWPGPQLFNGALRRMVVDRVWSGEVYSELALHAALPLHPNVVQLIGIVASRDGGNAGGSETSAYTIHEFVPCSLARITAPLTRSAQKSYAFQLLLALAVAHHHGLVLHDVQPDRCLIEPVAELVPLLRSSMCVATAAAVPDVCPPHMHPSEYARVRSDTCRFAHEQTRARESAAANDAPSQRAAFGGVLKLAGLGGRSARQWACIPHGAGAFDPREKCTDRLHRPDLPDTQRNAQDYTNLWHRSPEALLNQPLAHLRPAHDIWAVGHLLAQLFVDPPASRASRPDDFGRVRSAGDAGIEEPGHPRPIFGGRDAPTQLSAIKDVLGTPRADMYTSDARDGDFLRAAVAVPNAPVATVSGSGLWALHPVASQNLCDRMEALVEVLMHATALLPDVISKCVVPYIPWLWNDAHWTDVPPTPRSVGGTEPPGLYASMKDVPPAVKQLLARCWTYDPRKRITALEALQMPYFADVALPQVVVDWLHAHPLHKLTIPSGPPPALAGIAAATASAAGPKANAKPAAAAAAAAASDTDA